jgi:hypothetical protein
MDSFKFTIVFGGTCAFVPGWSENKRRAWVFLPKADKVDKDIERPGLRKHFAQMEFSAEHAAVKGYVPDTVNCLMPLVGDIHILPGGHEANYEKLEIPCFDPHDPYYKDRDRFAQDGCFASIAPLEEACLGRGHREGGTLNPKFLERTLDEKYASMLAARINLVEGKMTVTNYPISQDRPIAWRFRPFGGREEPGDHRQVLAFTVSVEITVPYEYVRLETRSLLSGDVLSQLDLYPYDDGHGPEVLIGIKNEESDQFFEDPPASPPVFKNSRQQDRIFELYYNLVRNPPPPGDQPILVADHLVGKGNPGGADSSPPCSPSRLAAVNY